MSDTEDNYRECDDCGKALDSNDAGEFFDNEPDNIESDDADFVCTPCAELRHLDERNDALVKEYTQEVCNAAKEVFGADYWMDALDNGAYCGEYDSVTAYAESWVDDTGMLADVPENIARYFDYEAFGRDMELGGDITEHNGYIFNNHW